MPDVRVVLVEPKFEGNVGAVARVMANFDVHELCLIRPCEVGDIAYHRAKHGAFILDDMRVVESLDDALSNCFFVVGTSGVVTKGDKNYVRIPVSAHSFAKRLKGYTEKVAIVFGREDIGLLQDELARCDMLVHIPSSEKYPVLNLSHAVGVILYEMFGFEIKPPTPADNEEKERLFSFFDNLLEAISYPEVRKKSTSSMFRKMMGRAIPTKYEYNTIMGVIGDAAKAIEGQKFNRPK
ncbi:MAG: RNA methyltransferase [archaeon]|nr:RNA methyltransferase [archaeon]